MVPGSLKVQAWPEIQIPSVRTGCTTSTGATILVPKKVIPTTKDHFPPSDNAINARHNLHCRQWPKPSLNRNNQPSRALLPRYYSAISLESLALQEGVPYRGNRCQLQR